MKTVVLVSGGMDSFLAAQEFPRSTKLFVDYGQPYLKMERRAVFKQFPDAQEVTISGLPSLEKTYVPARNLALASLAVRFGSNIVLGATKSEMTHDKTPEAFEEMSNLLTKFSKKRVRVLSPFWAYSKFEVALDYLESGGSWKALTQTVSCYGSSLKHCLKCNACLRRTAIFNRLKKHQPDIS
jgi:7-cyano-7-deazaguanine synthase in queuosine biosynthesis